MSETRLIAIDWGTTAARAYRLAEGGQVLEARHATLGVQQVAPGEFPSALASLLGDWQSLRVPRLACGMIGSRQGWIEAPYRECPVPVSLLAHGLTHTPQRELAIVSGIACRDATGVPDVMRGEETQVVGLLASAATGALVVQPGTHSKWTVVASEDGDTTIRAFATYMTGETFAVLREHSILGRLMRESSSFDRPAFEQGVHRAMEHGTTAGELLHRIFGARTLVLFDELAPAGAADYLSGILIGAEVAAGTRWAASHGCAQGTVWLAGGEALCMRYAAALRVAEVETRIAPADIAAQGLWRLASDAGLVT